MFHAIVVPAWFDPRTRLWRHYPAAPSFSGVEGFRVLTKLKAGRGSPPIETLTGQNFQKFGDMLLRLGGCFLVGAKPMVPLLGNVEGASRFRAKPGKLRATTAFNDHLIRHLFCRVVRIQFYCSPAEIVVFGNEDRCSKRKDLAFPCMDYPFDAGQAKPNLHCLLQHVYQ